MGGATLRCDLTQAAFAVGSGVMLERLEKYEILEEIGHGGMATVYRARDTRLDRLVAVKVMHPHLRGAGEARTRFAREAKTIARLKHPHILEVYDYSGEDSPESYIATELLTGPTLKQYVEQHPEMPAEIAACFAIEIARALTAAHAAGVVHRDVKPENVMLHENRTVKLTDFGIAQMVDAQSFTVTGQILGSPGHMAPEQIEGGDCDARTDVFSLGTVLYFLATGSLPFVGKNPHQVLKRVLDVDFVDPVRVRPTIGGKLGRIIKKALSRDPAARYQNAAEFERELEQFVAEAGVTDVAATLEEYLRGPAAVSERISREIVPKLVERGEAAVRTGAVADAHDYLNRVLALDEKNEQALALVEKLGRPRAHVGWIVAAVLVCVAAIGAVAFWHSSGARVPSPAAPAHVARPSSVEPPVRAPAAPAAPVSPVPAPAPELQAAPSNASPESHRVEGNGRRAARPPQAVGGSRTVTFAFFPGNVSLSVDGSAPKPVGPSYRSLELAAGAHTFKLTGAADCCVDEEWTQVVSAGAEPLEITRRLEFRPARLYIVTNVPAGVVVGAGIATGRSREVISVPMDRFADQKEVTITAPGHRAYTATIRLRAGSMTEPPAVTLAAIAGGE